MAPPTSAVATVDAHGEKVQAMFGAIAHGYDRANRWMSLGTDVRWRRRAVRQLASPNAGQPPSHILDLCAGTMDSSVEIHETFPTARVIAGDFSIRMLDEGRHKLVGKAGAQVIPTPMDAHELPVATASQDAIFCAFGIRNLSDLARATAEQARCLRPGGRLVVLDFFRPSSWLPKAFHGFYGRYALPLVGFAATGHLDAYLYLPRSIGRFLSVEDYVFLLERHGFDRVSVTAETFGIAHTVTMVRRGAPSEATT